MLTRPEIIEVLGAVGIAAAMSLKTRILPYKKNGKAVHKRGLRLLGEGALAGALRGWRPLIRGGIRVGRVWLPGEYEETHILITGATKSGKSNVLRQLLRQLRERKVRVVVGDPESEFAQEFYDEARGDWLLNPLDKRCPSWAPRDEIQNERMDIPMLTRAFVRESGMWDEDARMLLAGMLEVTGEPSEMVEFLRLPYPEIVEQLKGTQAQGMCDQRAVNQFSFIRREALKGIDCLQYLPPQGGRQWSVRKWDKGWVFLSATERSRAATLTLHGIWLDLLIGKLLDGDGSEKIWVTIDELAAMGAQPRLKEGVARGRKHGMCIVLGFQSGAQVREIYGREGATALLAEPATKLLLSVNEFDTAEWASQQIGEEEVQIEGQQGARRRLFLPADMQRLRAGRGVLIAGKHRGLIKIPYLEPQKTQPGFLPREMDSARPVVAIKDEETLEWQRWNDMIRRCYNPSDKNYRWYGKRGIAVCDEWREYKNFIADILDEDTGIGACPGEEYSLDRLRNDEGYKPENVAWRTAKEQRRNRDDWRKATLRASTHGEAPEAAPASATLRD